MCFDSIDKCVHLVHQVVSQCYSCLYIALNVFTGSHTDITHVQYIPHQHYAVTQK